MKAMILAAGMGKRMLPLTTLQPKPLLYAGKYRLIEHNLIALQKAGVNEVVINTHYLSKQIKQTVGDGRRFGLKITHVVENETLLGTGGGIKNALPHLGNNPFLLISADIWTDFPLEALMQRTVKDAHLVMVKNPTFHPSGDYTLDENAIIQPPNQHTLTFASLGLIHPHLLSYAKESVFDLATVLQVAIKKQRVTGEVYCGHWWNVGTPKLLKILDQFLLDSTEIKTMK